MGAHISCLFNQKLGYRSGRVLSARDFFVTISNVPQQLLEIQQKRLEGNNVSPLTGVIRVINRTNGIIIIVIIIIIEVLGYCFIIAEGVWDVQTEHKL